MAARVVGLGQLCFGVAPRRVFAQPQKAFLNKTDISAVIKRHVDVFIPVLNQLLGALQPAIDWFSKTGFLWAVPKKKVSYRRKRMRNRNKFPKNRTDIEVCVVCGNDKLEGHLCGHCLEKIMEETRAIQEQLPAYDLPTKPNHPLF